jgi:Tat protein secretion system quality control protein TatD with DNase activity
MPTMEDEELKKYRDLYCWLKYELPELAIRIKVAVKSFTDHSQVAEKHGITAIAVTNLPSPYALGVQPLRDFKHGHLALGLHPLAARDCLNSPSTICTFVGEIGLDSSPVVRGTREPQLRSFQRIAESISGRSRFVIIHPRGAEIEALEILQRYSLRTGI